MPDANRMMDMDVKIERAKQHLADLEVRIAQFVRNNPLQLVEAEEPGTGNLWTRVSTVPEPPQEWSAILGDVIHNLRSSLDYLVYQLVQANEETPHKNTAFPFVDNAAKFRDACDRRLQGVDNAAQQHIRATEPYPGGKDERLYQLHDLDIEDKHHLLLVTGIASDPLIDFGPSAQRLMQSLIPDAGISVPPVVFKWQNPQLVKDGSVVFGIGAAARDTPELNPRFYPVFTVAFGEGTLKGKPLIATLRQFVDLVEQVIEPFRPLLR